MKKIFNEGDKVIVRAKCSDGYGIKYIGGIHCHATKEFTKKIFGKSYKISSFWDSKFEGVIFKVGTRQIKNLITYFTYYLIKNGNDLYMMNNNYNEIEVKKNGK